MNVIYQWGIIIALLYFKLWTQRVQMSAIFKVCNEDNAIVEINTDDEIFYYIFHLNL